MVNLKQLIVDSCFKLVYGHDAVLLIEINLQNVRIARQNELPSKIIRKHCLMN